MKRVAGLLIVTSLLLLFIAVSAQQRAAAPRVAFDRREEMIQMRDGVHLYTLVYSPPNRTERLPIILERTPYGVGETRSPGRP